MWRKTLLQDIPQLNKKRRRGVKVRWQMISTWFAGSKYNVVTVQISVRDNNSGGGAKQSRDGSFGESDRVLVAHSKFLVWDYWNYCDLKIQFWFAQISGTMYEHASSLVNISFAKEPPYFETPGNKFRSKNFKLILRPSWPKWPMISQPFCCPKYEI